MILVGLIVIVVAALIPAEEKYKHPVFIVGLVLLIVGLLLWVLGPVGGFPWRLY